MEENCRAEWEKMDITKDELNRLGNALKNEEFRKLLVEYAQEINDPANKKIYEDEIKQLEQERGIDCTFINPEPGYVIKTSIDGKKKAFINVCMNENIGKPSSTLGTSPSGARGLTWSLPYSHVAPHEDLDKKSMKCTVFDVVFHPDTHRLAANNPQFKNMLNNTALDAVEENYHVTLDRKNLRFPKMTFKGCSRPSVIRKRSANPPPPLDEDSSFPPGFRYPYEDLPEQPKTNLKANSQKKVQEKTEKDSSPFTTPKYTIKYRDNVDIQDWTNDKTCKINAAIPKELVVSIFLPLLNTTADVELDVNEKWVQLKSTKVANYFLHLPLPYAVEDQSGTAKFDLSERKLVITLPVKRNIISMVDLNREDSGIDSDVAHSPESEHVPRREECASKVKVLSECVIDDHERTSSSACGDSSKSTAKLEPFLNPDVRYSPTNFTCNVQENIMAFTLHVKNVEPESVHYISQEGSVLQLKFSSIGAGFFPLHYAFYMKLTDGFTFVEDEVSFETWDNNVIVQVALNPSDSFPTEYYVGLDETTAVKQEMPELTVFTQKLADITLDEVPADVKVETTKSSEEEVVIEITAQKQDIQTPENDEVTIQEPPVNSSHKVELEKTRCYSESSGEEHSSSLARKGILKRRSVSRSLSESNMDDISSASSLDPLPETFRSDLCTMEEGTEEELAARKTARVRFNEVIAKQTFRINSSILGQRRKNQRKTMCKRRARERRASESEKEEVDEESNGTGDMNVSSSLDDDALAGDSEQTSEADSKAGSGDGARRKKSRGRKKKNANQGKHKAVKGDDMGFKNDLIFDLDM